MDNIIWHEHHIVPRHAGGTNDPSNLLKCNIAMHAFMHEQRYIDLGDKYDKLAAATLRGQVSKQEGIRLAMQESGRRSSQLNIGKKYSDERKRKISESHMGKKLSENHRRSISNSIRNSDAYYKSRVAAGIKTTGTRNGRVKLSETEVHLIKYMLLPSGMSNKDIAMEFNVGVTTIQHIRSNTNWRHI